MAKRTYEQWKLAVDLAVDLAVMAKVGLGIEDLPDVPPMDWYQSNVSPSSAANRAIRMAKEF
jgi:hypothetical protein